ncbi:MAG TPA: CHAT domain-containing protein [Thermoanaerobaculia bacterium]
MKKLVRILFLFSLCSALTACNERDPATADLGETRPLEARIAGADWRPYKAVQLRTTCNDEPADSREKALELLAVAGGECLDRAVAAVTRHSPEDLAAAYLVRAERNENPVDLLLALKTATGFNRALALEKLGLKKHAIVAWDEVVKERSQWSAEARGRRDALNVPEPAWRVEDLLAGGATLAKLARTFPSEVTLWFPDVMCADLGAARQVAEVLAETGERFPPAVVEAVAKPGGVEALQRACFVENLERRAALFEQAGNPLHLWVRYTIAYNSGSSLEQIEALAAATPPEYRLLSFRIALLRADVLESVRNQYFAANAAYGRALALAHDDPTRRAEVLVRRSPSYSTIGMPVKGLQDSLTALQLLDRVTDLNARHQAYGTAAMAVEQLGDPHIALLYQDAAVEMIRRNSSPGVNENLAVALRKRADLQLRLGRDDDAEEDLKEAASLANDSKHKALLQMRLREVEAQALVAKDPHAAVRKFDEAIALAEAQDSTYRAVLHFKRAAARRRAGQANADADVVTALRMLREEAKGLINSATRGTYEALWAPYFARFQEKHHDLVKNLLKYDDPEGAFVQAELARALEPMHLLVREQTVPGFRPIETKVDLRWHLARLPEDTVILQYLVLPEMTYAWVLTRGRIEVFELRPGRSTIEGWAARAADAMARGQRDLFKGPMRAAYAQLFEAPLAHARSKTRVVIIPDGPMHGLPFAGLESTSETVGYLIERASIAVDGSTSLYLYALARDAQFARSGEPSVLLVGNPAFAPRTGFWPLPDAEAEARELLRTHYPQARLLTGAEATIPSFLELARSSTIIHFAGHAIANARHPWESRLLLAARPPGDSGELTAERLMGELSELERTRLVILGACSTAGGGPVGPQGLAPLVRPLKAANVPAVVGTLWDVNDATAKDLLGSLHCHHRRGDDVAVALQQAQLERLRNNDPPMAWAPYQVVGYAASSWPDPATSEENHSDSHLCTANSFQRPDGLHPQ